MLFFHRSAYQASRQALLVTALLLALIVCKSAKAQHAAVQTPLVAVQVSAQVAGRTPARIGYNMGENLPGSNVSSWLRYAEVDGARFWWPQDVWPAGPAHWQGANDLAHFEAEKARLRAAPGQAIDWKIYQAGVARAFGGAPAGTIGHCFSLSELRKMGADVLIVLSRTTSRHAFEQPDGAPDWFGRWTYWRGVYLNAFYLAHHYDVQRFQLFNEPDHPSNQHIAQPDYIRRLQIGSDAIQAALADVNRLDHKSLRPQISAPVTAGLMVFGPRQGRPDTRDAQIGWGELAMRHRRDDFAGRSAGSEAAFQVYAFQAYGRNAARIANDLPALRRLIAAANDGAPLPIIVSEMNVSTAGDFAKTASTLDTPHFYASFGAIAAAYVNAGIDEIYIFRLTQATWIRGGVKKNGTHIIDNLAPLKPILRSTKGAEVARLFIRGFKGGRVRLAAPNIDDENVSAVAARDETDGTHTLLLTNLGAARVLALDLSAWKLPAGALITVEKVSQIQHGGVTQSLGLRDGGKFVLPLGADSVALLTVRPAVSGTARAVLPLKPVQNTWRVASPLVTGERALLALQIRAVKPVSEPLRVRIYGGAGPVVSAELLGQAELMTTPERAMIDVTRYAKALKGGALILQIVAEGTGATSFHIDAAELRIFGALPKVAAR